VRSRTAIAGSSGSASPFEKAMPSITSCLALALSRLFAASALCQAFAAVSSDWRYRAQVWSASQSDVPTCAEWNETTGAARTSTAATLLAKIRGFEAVDAAPPTDDQVARLADAIDPLCGAGSDCETFDAWCDTAYVSEPAVWAYQLDYDLLTP
jgi:hypothetical protein